MHRVIVLELYQAYLGTLSYKDSFKYSKQLSEMGTIIIPPHPDTYSFSNPPASHNWHAVHGKARINTQCVCLQHSQPRRHVQKQSSTKH